MQISQWYFVNVKTTIKIVMSIYIRVTILFAIVSKYIHNTTHHRAKKTILINQT